MSSFESSGFDGFLEKADQQFPKMQKTLRLSKYWTCLMIITSKEDHLRIYKQRLQLHEDKLLLTIAELHRLVTVT